MQEAGSPEFPSGVDSSAAAMPSYPAARLVARRLSARADASPAAFTGAASASRPPERSVEAMITSAFWASLLREEGRAPTISLAYVAPEQAHWPLRLGRRLPLDPAALAHLAPAVSRPGIHLGVWDFDGAGPLVWGATRTLPDWCFVLEVVSPGLLVVKYKRPQPATKFANLAVLEGASVRFIEQQQQILEEAPAALRTLLDFYATAGHSGQDEIIVRLAMSMRATGAGGTMLVVPGGSGAWAESVVQPVAYCVTPEYAELGSLISACCADRSADSSQAVSSAVATIAGLTAVDGATVLSDHFNLLAFGAKIRARNGTLVETVLLTEPVEGAPDRRVDAASLGGTRHLSAAQFAADQRDSLALVASVDGRFTVFAWSPAQQAVRAHRLEPLLL